MSSFTDSEKVQYALKYALNVTMQHKSLSAYAEERAPKRIFPSNIMSKDIISKDEGDLDADGNYLQGHVFNPAGTLTVAANISTPVTTVQYYKIVDPSINVVSNVTVNDILSNPDITGMSYDSIAALGDSSVDSNDPWYNKAVKIQQLQKAWFFRGRYGGAASEGDMFSYATTNYIGLYLAYNKISAGTVVDVTDATKVVPHIKLYLQVQTENIATGSDGTGDVDNMSFRHSLLENMLGLESGFANVVPVQGPHYTSSSSEKMPIIQTGIMGNEWYSQDTYGMLSFYALGSGSHTVADNYPDPSTPHGTSSPLVSYLRYTGETAATTGIGGGGGTTTTTTTVSTVGLGGTFMGDQLVPVDQTALTAMIDATSGTSIGDGEFNVYTDIDLRGGSTLLLDGTPAVFSNWVEDASNNISRDSDVTVTGDLQLNGTLKDASGNARIFSNWTIDGSDLTRDSNVTVTGDLQLNGTLKDASNNARIFSNWGISGENIYRESKVGIGMNNPLHALDISGDLNVVGNVTVNSVNATEAFDYIAPINQLQEVNEVPTWDNNVTTTIGFDELIDGNIPESLDTLKEIAELVKDISNSNALSAGLGLKANKHSPIFTGNVGIGQVANVNYALDISGDLNITSGALKLNGQTPVYSNWTVHSNTTDIYRPSGNVGIGTDSPDQMLHLAKTTSSNNYLRFTPTEYSEVDGWDMGLVAYNTYTTSGYDFILKKLRSGTTGNILIPDGNVGIGTLSPGSYKLHVNGNTYIAGTLQATSTITAPTFSGALSGNANSASQVYVTSGATTNSSHYIAFTNAGSSGNGYIYSKTDLTYNPNTGYVGIGTTSFVDTRSILHIKKNVGISFQADTGQTNSRNWRMRQDDYGAWGSFQISVGSNNADFGDSSNDVVMTMLKNRNVGIGTTDPNAALEIHGGAGSGDEVLILSNSKDSAATGIHSIFSQGGHHYDVYDSTTIQAGKTTSNGQALHLNHYSAGNVCIGNGGGNVGIGTSSPSCKLEIYDDSAAGQVKDILHVRNYAGYDMVSLGTSANFHSGSISIYKNSNTKAAASVHIDGSIQHTYFNGGGFVGIGTTNPDNLLHLKGNYPLKIELLSSSTYYLLLDYNQIQSNGDKLHLNHNTTNDVCISCGGGRVSIGNHSFYAKLSVNAGATGSFGGDIMTNSSGWTGASGSLSTMAIYTNGNVGIFGVLRTASDRRIKQNIEDVPDNLALEMVRNIPCRYYEYIDKINRDNGKTIGFIAQEVKEHFPMAVTIHKEILPNKMFKLNNISWNEVITDGDKSSYKLISDLQDVSGVKYKFIVSDDENSKVKDKIIIGNSDNTFTFQKSWNYVFCYGSEVDDFHMLDKHKLFALNFSATQELDRQQLADKAEIISLKTEVETIKQENEDLKFQMALLRSELTTIKAHLGI